MIFLFSYVSICRLFPDSSEGGKEPVDMRPDQEKVEAEIKPEHYDDDCGKAAVHVKSVKVLDVNRKPQEKIFQVVAENTAPGIWWENFSLQLGI